LAGELALAEEIEIKEAIDQVQAILAKVVHDPTEN
jgi:hypothetical protein